MGFTIYALDEEKLAEYAIKEKMIYKDDLSETKEKTFKEQLIYTMDLMSTEDKICRDFIFEDRANAIVGEVSTVGGGLQGCYPDTQLIHGFNSFVTFCSPVELCKKLTAKINKLKKKGVVYRIKKDNSFYTECVEKNGTDGFCLWNTERLLKFMKQHSEYIICVEFA